MKVVLFFGYSGSGKTTAIEHVTAALVRSGFKVGTVKHVHDPNFTIDTPGKDTWRHARAGASAVVAMAAGELALVKRPARSRSTAGEAIGLLRGEGVDFALVEGLSRAFYKDDSVIRVLCAADVAGVRPFIRTGGPPIACVTGRVAGGRRRTILGLKVIRLPSQSAQLMKMMGAT